MSNLEVARATGPCSILLLVKQSEMNLGAWNRARTLHGVTIQTCAGEADLWRKARSWS